MSVVVDLLVINLVAYFLPINLTEALAFHSYISISWLIVALRTHFYAVQRYSKVTYVLRLLVRQSAIYFLLVYAFIGFFKQLTSILYATLHVLAARLANLPSHLAVCA